MVVEQQSHTAGVRTYNYQSYYPQLYGVYTCSVPTQGGKTVISNVAVYSSLPGNSVHHCIHELHKILRLRSNLVPWLPSVHVQLLQMLTFESPCKKAYFAQGSKVITRMRTEGSLGTRLTVWTQFMFSSMR